MIKTELKKYQTLLEKREQELLRGLQQREGIEIEIEPDVIDEAQRTAERDLAIHNLDRDSVMLRHVRSALARIRDGSFGVCMRCEEEISPRRLVAVPWAPLCLKCQEEADAAGDEESEWLAPRLEPAA